MLENMPRCFIKVSEMASERRKKEKKKRNAVCLAVLCSTVVAGLALDHLADLGDEQAERVPECDAHPVRASAPLHHQSLDKGPNAERNDNHAEDQPNEAARSARALLSATHLHHFCHKFTSTTESAIGYINIVVKTGSMSEALLIDIRRQWL
jgi:hypothetical protein